MFECLGDCVYLCSQIPCNDCGLLMKRIITFYLTIFFSVCAVYGVARSDSVKVFFALNKASFDTTLDCNAASMEKFIDSVVVAANSGMLDHIVVYGYASPDGPFRINDRLAIRRCNVIADYISRHAGIPMDDIRTLPGGVAWDGLRTLVIEGLNIPSRDAVIQILNEYLPDAATDRIKSDQCVKRLIAIDGGHTYEWLLKNLFPRLRFSMAVYTSSAADSSAVQPIDDNIENTDVDTDTVTDLDPDIPRVYIEDFDADSVSYTGPASVECISPVEYDSHVQKPAPIPYDPLYRLAVKTNLLYYAALMPNIEVEYLVNDNWSVSLEGNVAWWGKYSNNKSYRLAIISPEVRRWIRPRAPWHGLYVGAFAGGGWYDFQNGGNGYRGEGGMGGLSVGYMWPLGRHLSLEAEFGAGYLYTRYKEYMPVGGHHVYQRTKDLNYFGPLKVKFSLVWRFWDMNKSRNRNAGILNKEGI